MEVLEKVSRAIAADYGVTVTFSGTRAYTDCKTINLPMIPEEMLNEESIDLLRGYCDHEIAHVLYSSSDILKSREFTSASEEVSLLTGIIEDIRVESVMSKKYEGSRVNLERLADIIAPETNVKHPFGALIIEGRNKVCGFNIECEHRGELADGLKKFFKEPRLFERIAETKSSEDSFNLAKELIKNALDKQDSPPPPQQDEESDISDDGGAKDKKKSDNKPEKGEENKDSGSSCDEGDSGGSDEGNGSCEGDSDGDGEDGEGDSKGSGEGGEGDSDGEGKGSGKGEARGKCAGSGEGEWKGEGGGESGEHGNGGGQGKSEKGSVKEVESSGNVDSDGMFDSASESFAKASTIKNPVDSKIKDFLKEVGDKLRKRGAYIPYSTSFDEVKPVGEAPDGEKMYLKMRNELGNIGSVKSKISSLFTARVAGHWMLGKERGRVNNRALCGVHSGRKDLFKERFTCNDVDTAITFLIDMSGSMHSHDKIGVAMRTTAMFCEILNGTKVKFEVLGFTSGKTMEVNISKLSSSERDEDYRERDSLFCRTEALSTYIFKSFSEPMGATIKRRIGSYANLQMRNNYDGESLLVAFKRLMKRKEARKIMFVLSDGAPCGNVRHDEGRVYLKSVASSIEDKSPVELVGIGYMSNDVKRYYKNHILVNKAVDLPPMMLKELKRILKVS